MTAAETLVEIRAEHGKDRMTGRIRRYFLQAIVLTIVGSPLFAEQAQAGARIIEFQFEAEKLFDLIQIRFQQALLHDDLCGLRSSGLVVDHLWLPDGVRLQRGDEHLQLVVPMEVYTKTEDCVQDPTCGCNEYWPPWPLAFELVYDIVAEGADVCLQTNVDDLPEGLAFLVQTVCFSLPLERFESLVGGELEVERVGVSADQSLMRLAIRVEYRGPYPKPPVDHEWNSFLAGEIAPRAPVVDEWSVFIDEELLRDANVRRMTDSEELQEVFELASPPDSAWVPLAREGGNLDISIAGDLWRVGLCTCPESIPITVQINAHYHTHPPQMRNEMHCEIGLEVNATDEGLRRCLPTMQMVPRGGGGGINVAPTVGPVEDIEGAREAVRATVKFGFGELLPEECRASEKIPWFLCAYDVDLEPIDLNITGSPVGPWDASATLTLSEVYGLPEGLVLSGPMEVSDVPGQGLLSVGTTHRPEFGPVGGCGSAALDWAPGRVHLGPAGGRICEVSPIDDELGVFEVAALGGHSLLSGLTVHVAFTPVEAYWEQGYHYPCRLVIRTTVGSCCVEIEAPEHPPAPGTEEYMRLLADLIKDVGHCESFVAFWPGGLDPRWWIDPDDWWNHTPVHVRFDDASLSDRDVTAKVTNLHVTNTDRIEATFDEGDQLHVLDASCVAHVDVQIDVGAIGKALNMANSKETFTASVSQTFRTDLAGQRLNEGQAELAFVDAVPLIIEIPVEQLPAGIQKASIQLSLDPALMSLIGNHYPALESGTESGVALVIPGCGAGLCGAGAFSTMALTFCVLGMMKCTCRRGRL